MTGRDSDTALLEAWRAGDSSAFDRLMENYEPRVMSYLTQMTRSRAEAEDLFQETFLRVFRHADDMGSKAPLDFTILRIARNLAISRARRGGVERRGLDIVRRHTGEPAATVTDELESAETGRHVRAAVQALADDLKETVTLKLWSGLNWEQIGELMGFSADTAARRFSEALDILNRELGPRLGIREETSP